MAEIQDSLTSHVSDKFDGDPARCHPNEHSTTSEYQEEEVLLLNYVRVRIHAMKRCGQWSRHINLTTWSVSGCLVETTAWHPFAGDLRSTRD